MDSIVINIVKAMLICVMLVSFGMKFKVPDKIRETAGTVWIVSTVIAWIMVLF